MSSFTFNFQYQLYWYAIESSLKYKIHKNIANFPLFFQIQTINDCNGSCIMCPNNSRRNIKHKMSDDLFKKIIDEININVKSKTIISLFLQNEPFLDKNLFEKIEYIQKKNNKNILINIITNGSLITDHFIKKIVDYKNLYIIISLDAFTKQTYNKIRKGLDYGTVLSNINKLKNSGFNKKYIAVEFVIQQGNINEYRDFMKYWKNKTGSILVHYMSDRSGNLSNFFDISLKYKNYPFIEKIYFYIIKNSVRYCSFPFISFNILSNGNVIICPEDWNGKTIVGNLNNSSIKDIWMNKEYRQIRSLIINKMYKKIPVCDNCYKWNSGKLKL